MTLWVNDWQSESDLDSVRNSCDVFARYAEWQDSMRIIYCFGTLTLFCKVCWLAKRNQQPCPGKEAPSLLRRNRRKMDSWPRCWRRERCLWRSHSQWWFRSNRGTLLHWRRGSARDPSGKYWGERNPTCVRWSCNTCGWDVQDGPPKHLHPALRLPARHDHQQRAWQRRRGLFQEPGWEHHWGFSRHLLGEVKQSLEYVFSWRNKQSTSIKYFIERKQCGQ